MRTPRGLHGVTAVAALKPAVEHPRRAGAGCLHGVTAVAALKPRGAPSGSACRARSPRRHCRGRIEAPTPRGPTRPGASSPRRHCRGRIEAHRRPAVARRVRLSPRRHCRGRIEATRGRCITWRPPSLHGVTAVAALKQVAVSGLGRGEERLHGVTAVAALKRVDPAGSSLARFLSPRRHCRGRIEARSASD